MGTSVALLVGVLLGVVLGLIAGIFFSTGKTETQKLLRTQSEQTLRDQLAAAQRESDRWRNEAESLASLKGQLATETTLAAERLRQAEALRTEVDTLRQQWNASTETDRSRSAQISHLETTLQKERESAHEKLKLLTDAKAELTNQFEALAGKILDEKSTKFTEQNKLNLDQLLGPLRLQINDFRGKVEEAQKDSLAGRVELRSKLESLEKLNQQLTAEAHNLTTALRGSSKAQGDWGEFILRDLLEKAGLREGEQYSFQESFSGAVDEDGARGKAARTDVILNLPGGRHLVVDSKVSLNAYTDYCNAAADELRKSALRQHLVSVRAHLDGLSKRNYHKLAGLESPDFVVMFIPVEPAFLLAMQEAGDLWREAYERNVLLVGPTTLLFVIRIVDNLWQQEQQARSVADIVDRGTKLYEKFVNFVSDLTKIGDSLRAADASYQSAMSKLGSGSGNLIRQTEMLKKAGIRTSKQLPPKLLETAGLDAEEQAELTLAASGEATPEAS
ncbi:DNA recombination protein RmuC [Acidicapsa ligni]|uniref:DNA recombination protein RmuC n=1 Tax=Acidicapsa ligni TaxID=542300 RepID=UPI0021E05205|nr:DNA recombination protein RmuC [Acidicapsa ligni]